MMEGILIINAQADERIKREVARLKLGAIVVKVSSEEHSHAQNLNISHLAIASVKKSHGTLKLRLFFLN